MRTTNVVAWFAAYAILLVAAGIGVGLVTGGASYAVSGDKKKKGLKAIAWGVGGSLVAIGGVGGAYAAVAGPGGDGDTCPPGYVLDATTNTCKPTPGGTLPDWGWLVLSDEDEASHDVATEYPDGPYVACDGGSPDDNAEQATWDTDLFWDAGGSTVTYRHDITTTVATSSATFAADQCWTMDIFLWVSNMVDNDRDGTMDNLPYYMRYRDFSSTVRVAVAGNATDAAGPLFYVTTAAGWHFGGMAEVDAPALVHSTDHRYFSACAPGEQGYSTAGFTEACYGDWEYAGLADDGDEDVIGIWQKIRTEGLCGYNFVANVDHVRWTVDIGWPDRYFSVHVDNVCI